MSTDRQDSCRRQSLLLLDHLARIARCEMGLEGGPDGLRPMHFLTLRTLRDHGGASQRCLADALRLDPSNLVALLDRLEDMDCVTRRRDPDDRRRHVVDLTPAGRATLADVERQLARAENVVFEGLTNEQRSLLHDLLRQAAGAHNPGRHGAQPA